MANETTILHVSDGVDLEPGWYPVMLCWDAHEGFFPSAAEWSGSAFKRYNLYESDPIACYWPIKFDTEVAAQNFADDNDPNW